MGNSEKGHIYIPHLEQNNLPFSSFRWCLSRNRLTINATTYTFLERSFRDLSANVWVVALIVYHFRDKRQKRSCVAVFGVYLENGKQSMLQPIHCRKDLFESFPEMYGLVALIVYRFRDKRQ